MEQWSTLTKEGRLMILASRIELTPEQQSEIEAILASGIKIDQFLALCIKHKVLPLVSQHVIRLDHSNQIKLEYKKVINHAYQGNKMKNQQLMNELKDVLAKAHEQELRIIPLKGAWLISNIYRDIGLRISNDLDFLISLDQSEDVSRLLRTMGYLPGQFNWSKDDIDVATEDEVIEWRTRSGNLHPHMKRVDNGCVKYFGIDFSYDVDLKRTFTASNGLLERTQTRTIDGVPVACLETIDFLIHIAIHLYKEASYEKWTHLNQDINLIKFCDIREYILAHPTEMDWELIALRARELAAEEAIFYSFYYLELIFGDSFFTHISSYLNITNDDFLTAYVTISGERGGKWRKSFFDRFFSLSNADEFEQGTEEMEAEDMESEGIGML